MVLLLEIWHRQILFFIIIVIMAVLSPGCLPLAMTVIVCDNYGYQISDGQSVGPHLQPWVIQMSLMFPLNLPLTDVLRLCHCHCQRPQWSHVACMKCPDYPPTTVDQTTVLAIFTLLYHSLRLSVCRIEYLEICLAQSEVLVTRDDVDAQWRSRQVQIDTNKPTQCPGSEGLCADDISLMHLPAIAWSWSTSKIACLSLVPAALT